MARPLASTSSGSVDGERSLDGFVGGDRRAMSSGGSTARTAGDGEKARFDLVLLRRFAALARVMFPSATSVPFCLFFVLLGLSLLEELVVYNVGVVPSRFYGVLGNKDKRAFYRTLWISLVLVAMAALVKSAQSFVAGLLHVVWRKRIVTHLHELYLMEGAFYDVNVLRPSVDNADQRIVQDSDNFSSKMSTVLAKVIVTPLTIAYYSYQCNHVFGLIGPFSVVGYFALATIANRFIISRIVELVVRQERLEGSFRYAHARLRYSCESVAFQCGEPFERRVMARRARDLFSNQRRIVWRQLPLNVSVNLFDYFGSILSYFVIAAPIFAGTYDDLDGTALSSLISKSTFMAMYLINCFSTIVDVSIDFTDAAGYAHRIGSLLEALVEEKASLRRGEAHLSEGSDRFRLERVCYYSPTGDAPLIQGLSFEVMPGKNLLVVGPSGSGRSSLLRVLKGLWPIYSGVIERPSSSAVFYLPQRPYATDGTFLDQIVYPTCAPSYVHADDHSDAVSEISVGEESARESSPLLAGNRPHDAADRDAALRVLVAVGLGLLVERAGGIDGGGGWDWHAEVSPGELQRIGFARMLYHWPSFAVLDEATSAVSEDAEEMLYRECSSRAITVISTGHRSTLAKFHHSILYLGGNGEWRLEENTSFRGDARASDTVDGT